MFDWISGWFDKILVERIVGLLIRRVLDYIGSVLVVMPCFGTTLCIDTATFLEVQTANIVTVGIGLALLAISALLSFAQKKKDLKAIKEKDLEIENYKQNILN